MEHVSCWQLWKFSWVLEGTNLWKMLFKLAKNGKVLKLILLITMELKNEMT